MTRAKQAEKVLQMAEAWRDKNRPSCAESLYDMDHCIINAANLLEDIYNLIGYYDYSNRKEDIDA